MQYRTSRETRAGITLVEVMFALLIFSASLAGIYAIANQCLRVVADLKDESCALRVAQSEIERLRAASLAGRLSLVAEMDSSQAPALATLRDGQRVVNVREIEGKPGLAAVSVTVTWTARNGTNRQMNLSTIMVVRSGPSR